MVRSRMNPFRMFDSSASDSRLSTLDSRLLSVLRQGERVERAAAAEQHILPAVELVGDRRIADAADSGVPERRAIARAHGDGVPDRIASERDARCGGQHAGARISVAELVVPANFAG